MQGAPAGAGADKAVIIWNGTVSNLDIKDSMLEPMATDPTDGRYDESRIRAPLQWSRLRIDNQTDSEVPLMLRSTDPMTHMLILIDASTERKQKTLRESVSRRDRFPESEYHLLRNAFQLEPGLRTFYVGQSSYLGTQNLQLLMPDRLHADESRFTLFAGFMLGAVLIMMVSALLYYATLSHQALLSYAFYTFMLLSLLLNLSGLNGLILAPVINDWFERHLALTLEMTLLGLMEFSLAILDLKSMPRFAYTALRVQSGLASLMIVIAVFLQTDRILFGFTQLSCAIAILSLLAITMKLSWPDFRPLRFYIGGLACFLIGGTLLGFGAMDKAAGLDPVLCFMAGSVLQILLFSFSVRDRLLRVSREHNHRDYQLQESRALIYILTHDLSGPLFVIQSMAELQEGKTGHEPRIRQSFEKIRLAAQSAQAMLKVVKELEAIEAGKMDLILRPVPLLAALQTTLDTLKSRADAKQVTIEVHAQVSEEDYKKILVMAERTVLENTILYNLVSNAIKFSKPNERILISVEILDKDQVAIRIKDTGIGIPKTLITRLFSHNSKTSRRGTAGEKGTGLGLPLAQRYVMKFGGSIEVQSQAQEEFPEDHWTQFTVKLKKAA